MTSSGHRRHGTTTLHAAIERVADACTQRDHHPGSPAFVDQVLLAYSR